MILSDNVQVELSDFIKATTEGEELYLAGCASTSELDKEGDVMSLDALRDMAKAALGKPLVINHNHEGLDEFGDVVDAHVDDKSSPYKLFIKAKLRKGHPYSKYAHDEVEANPNKYGYSVYVTAEAHKLGRTRLVKSVASMKHIAFTTKGKNGGTYATVTLAKAFSDETIKPDSLCASCSNPIEEPMETNKTELEKAGAVLSSATKLSLKDIHDMGSPEVKTKVRALLGDDADELLGVEVPNLADGDADDNDNVEDAIGIVVGKAEVEDTSQAPATNKVVADADEKTDIINLIKSEFAKLQAPTKIEVVEPQTDYQAAKSLLRKALERTGG